MDFFNNSLVQGDKIQEDLKKGDMVVIQHLPNSSYNIYKGYYAEIREYRKNNDVATISLIATANQKHIRVPVEHFKKLPK